MLVSSFACAQVPAPTPTPTPVTVTIPVGIIMDQTGPVGGSALHCFRGATHYFRWLNDKGGVNGVKIDVLWADNKYTVPLTISAYQRFKDQGAKLFIMYGGPDGLAAAGLAKVDKIPIVNGSRTKDLLFPPSVTFCPGAGYGNEPTAVLKWFLDKWDKPRKPKVASILLDAAPGKAIGEGFPWIKENLKRADGLQYEWIETVWYPMVNPSFRTQLAKVMEQNPDLIVSFGTAAMTGQLWKDAFEMGITGVTFSTLSPPAGGSLVLAIAGDKAVEGKMVVTSYAQIEDTTVPGIQTIREAQQKYQGYVYDDQNYLEGWAMGAIGTEAIRIAISKVGAAKVTPSDVLDAMQTVTNFDIGGISGPVTFAPDKRLGTNAVKLQRYQGGKLVTFTDWITVLNAVPELK